MVKKAARQLLQGEHTFNEDFEHNKILLRGLMPSKPIQNKIAGYIGRLMKAKKKVPKQKAPSIEQPLTMTSSAIAA